MKTTYLVVDDATDLNEIFVEACAATNVIVYRMAHSLATLFDAFTELVQAVRRIDVWSPPVVEPADPHRRAPRSTWVAPFRFWRPAYVVRHRSRQVRLYS